VIDQSIFESATTLPVWADSRTTSGGFGLKITKTDNIIIPHRGFIVEAEITAGKKTILKNSSAPDELYDDILLETGLYKGNASVSLFEPLTRTLHLMGSTQAGYLQSKSLFENDLFQIGGLSILRGFDEKSIPVSLYSVSTIEMRFFLEQFSYLTIFTDYAATQQMKDNIYSFKYYVSIGTGLSFSTNAGIFNIFYALGKQNPGEFVVRNGKIHFGYVARF
jgi:outer membrane protein assembly factor BamA